MNALAASFRLDGRRALVTGSSSGIGAAIALAFAEAGADVMIHHAGCPGPANEIVGRIRQLGRLTGLVEADFSDPAAPRTVHAAAEEALGGLDILVSNVAVQHPSDWTQITREQFDTQVAVNWRSALELIQLAAPAMLARGWGRVLTIGIS